MTLGARIKSWREALGIKQRAIADAAAVSVSAVSHWENDDNAPNQQNLTATVGALGITFERFYGEIPRAPESKVAVA